ncbi:MAG: DUF6173 family protein [Veillonellales bacterium]
MTDFSAYSALTMAVKNPLHAETQYEIILDSIKEFEKNLNDNEEIALKLASFGQTVILNVTHIEYSNPSLIHFYGYVEGKKATIIQHINQLSFMIMAVPVEPKSKPRRIGFETNN